MFEQYVAELNHADPVVRYEAAHKLGESNDSRAVAPLISALPDNNAKVQYAAVSGLIKLGTREAAAPIVNLLIEQRSSQVWNLLKLNIGLRLRSGLLAMIEAGDTTIAERAQQALAEAEFDEQQRAFMVRVLGRAADGAHVEILIDTLVRESEIMQAAAAEALGWIGDARAISPLMLFLKDGNDALREIAVEALGRIGDPRVVDALIGMLGDPSEWVRRAAAVALGELGDSKAMDRLSEAMRDPNEVVQDAAFEAIKKLSGDHYTTVL